MLTHIARLPYGFVAEFKWLDDHTTVMWEPTVPKLSNNRARRTLVTAYVAARGEFYRMVSAATGKCIGVVDIGPDNGTLAEIIKPPVRH